MKNFCISTQGGQRIGFHLYSTEAPNTCEAFLARLPFEISFLHARVSGQEVWTDHAPGLDIIQENASVFTAPGEIVIGPLFPARNRIRRCMGIFYGPGQLLDCGNVFGKVWNEDLELLQALGDAIWRKGEQVLKFEMSSRKGGS